MSTQIAVSPLTLSDAEDVDELMKRNSHTLGFLPRKVLAEYILKRTAIGAKTVRGELAGYLIYAANPVRFRVAHLCVADAFRGQGIARRLIDTLKDAATTQTGISLHCRRDYPANELWPVLGFLPLSERPARTPGRRLTRWYFDLHELAVGFHGGFCSYLLTDEIYLEIYRNKDPEDRLGLFRAQTSDETVDIVVDSQVLFDLHEPDNDTTRVSKSLQSDFMVDSVRILLTDDIYLEIYRNKDLYEMCDGKVTTEIMALLFSHTFLFREPISLAAMREIYHKYHIGLTLQSPQRITADVFEEIFRRGFAGLS